MLKIEIIMVIFRSNLSILDNTNRDDLIFSHASYEHYNTSIVNMFHMLEILNPSFNGQVCFRDPYLKIVDN